MVLYQQPDQNKQATTSTSIASSSLCHGFQKQRGVSVPNLGFSLFPFDFYPSRLFFWFLFRYCFSLTISQFRFDFSFVFDATFAIYRERHLSIFYLCYEFVMFRSIIQVFVYIFSAKIFILYIFPPFFNMNATLFSI